MPIRLIVSDLDSTLLDEKVTLSRRTIEAFHYAQAQGVMTTLASGRMYGAMARFAQALHIELPVLACQGAAVVDVRTGEVLSQRPVPLALAQEFLRFAEEEGAYAQYYSAEGYFMEAHCPESEGYARLAGVEGTPVGAPLWKRLDYDPLKALIIAPPPRIQELLPKAKALFDGKLEVTTSMANYLEVTHPEAKKGDALRRLAAILGVEMTDIMAFGDAPNDISMLTAAGLGIAVGNAHPDVKRVAKYVTDSQKEDGVAKAIEKFIGRVGSQWPA